ATRAVMRRRRALCLVGRRDVYNASPTAMRPAPASASSSSYRHKRPKNAQSTVPTSTPRPVRVSIPSAFAMAGYSDVVDDLGQHLLAANAAQLCFGAQRDAVAEDRLDERLDVVGCDVATLLTCRVRLGDAHQRQGATSRHAEAQVGMGSRGVGETDDVVVDAVDDLDMLDPGHPLYAA